MKLRALIEQEFNQKEIVSWVQFHVDAEFIMPGKRDIIYIHHDARVT